MRGRCFFLNVTLFFCGDGGGCGDNLKLSFGWMELMLYDTVAVLHDTRVLEPLAVLRVAAWRSEGLTRFLYHYNFRHVCVCGIGFREASKGSRSESGDERFVMKRSS